MFPSSLRRALSGLCVSAMLAAVLAVGLPASAALAATCTLTGFVRDGNDLTAAMINPVGTVHGDVDATGCNIGIYYGPGSLGKLSKATVHGANYFGVVNNGGKVDVTKSTIRDIGESPLNGTQHGIGIAFVQDTPGTSGNITGNRVKNYQRDGILVRGPSTQAKIKDNKVTGSGPVDLTAQNGIEVDDGAKANIHDNEIDGNSYTGANGLLSAGILVFGGCSGFAPVTGITIDDNELKGNDVGIFLLNGDGTCAVASSTETSIVVKDNKISNKAVTNAGGSGAGVYQAGISDFGNHDSISKNKICGIGYTPVAPPPSLFFIDTTGSINPQLSGNKTTKKC